MATDTRVPRRRGKFIWFDRRRHTGALSAATTVALPPDRVALQWLLVTGVMACAPLALQLPLWVSAAFAVTVGWRYLCDRFQIYRPGRVARYALLTLLLGATYVEYGGFFGRDPGLALLVVLLGLKLLELHNRRDAMLIVFLLYVALLGGFLFGQTLVGALWALATVVISLGALIRLHQAMPTKATLRLAGTLLLQALPLMLVLYAFFPRISGALWRLPSDAVAGRTGMSDEMSPGSINQLSQSGETALRVDFLGAAPPPARELYWRGLVLTTTDGKTWKRGSIRAPTAASFHALSPALTYRVTLEPTSMPWLYALELPVEAPAQARLWADYTLTRADAANDRISYTLASHTRYHTGALASFERRGALLLPPLSARVRALARQLRAEHAAAATVQSALDYFRQENFVYTLTPPLLGNDPVDQFLFETRRGFCEHYASAFVTLMRAAGVPARVVVGYQGGEFNPTGNYLIVRQSDAHAWAEVWLPERGWTRVDPTAAVAPERIELGADAARRLEQRGVAPGTVDGDLLARALELPWLEEAARRARLYWDYTNLAWYRWVIDYQRERQESFLRRLGFDSIDWPRILFTVGGVCTLLLLGYAMWSRRTPPPDSTQRLYLRFCRRLARVGLERAAHEGPFDFARRAAGERPDLAPAINAITEQYVAIRYGEAGDAAPLQQAVRAFRASRR
jgi:protein-glutamine gamma-glutamyltransferase